MACTTYCTHTVKWYGVYKQNAHQYICVLGVRENKKKYRQQRSCYWPLSLDVLFTDARANVSRILKVVANRTTALSTTSLSLFLSPFDAKKTTTTFSWVFYIISVHIYKCIQMSSTWCKQISPLRRLIFFDLSNKQLKTPCRTGSEGPTQRELDDFRDRYPIDSRAYGVGYQELILSWIYVKRCEDCELGCCDFYTYILLIWENWDLS